MNIFKELFKKLLDGNLEACKGRMWSYFHTSNISEQVVDDLIKNRNLGEENRKVLREVVEEHGKTNLLDVVKHLLESKEEQSDSFWQEFFLLVRDQVRFCFKFSKIFDHENISAPGLSTSG